MKLAGYRAKRRAELFAAIRDCEAILNGVTLGPAYRRAFAAVVRAGQRYDRVRGEATEFEEISLGGAEPDDVASAMEDALRSGLETWQGVRETLSNG